MRGTEDIVAWGWAGLLLTLLLFRELLRNISGQVEIKLDRDEYEKQQAQRRRVVAINPKKHKR